MRLRIATLITKILLLLAGAALLVTGVFAYQLGLDHSASWGKGRILLASAGAFFLLAAAALQFWAFIRKPLARCFVPLQSIIQTMHRSRLSRAYPSFSATLLSKVNGFPPVAYLRGSSRRTAVFFCGMGVCITLFFYLFYLTNGTLTTWSSYTTYFDKLANAFQAGQLSLLEKPPEPLLALANPYDYHNRADIGVLWDASFYNGKYYYYWGPVPALVALSVKILLGSNLMIDDQYLLFAFCAGLVVLLALILARLRSVFFIADAPAWTLLPLVMFGGLSIPVFWLINRPSVYETAIAGGQFFLFLGLYAALRYLTSSLKTVGWLLLAGLAWGAAVNCRLNLAVAVAFFVLFLVWKTLRAQPNLRPRLIALAWLGIPLMLWALSMAWYNFARFGSIFETGHRYQLTGPALPPNYAAVTSITYVLPSLYSYLVRPLQFLPREFPFFFAPFVKETMWPWWIRLPKYYYYPEPVAGLLTAIPAVWIAFLPLLGWVRRGWSWLNERTVEKDPCAAPSWLWIWVAGGAVCLFAPLLVFISTSMRYLADVTPMLSLVAAIGWWWGLHFWRQQPAARRLLSLAALALIFTSVAMSLLVNFTNGDKRFATLNPALYAAIARFFH